jgi:hypothetical protein
LAFIERQRAAEEKSLTQIMGKIPLPAGRKGFLIKNTEKNNFCSFSS